MRFNSYWLGGLSGLVVGFALAAASIVGWRWTQAADDNPVYTACYPKQSPSVGRSTSSGLRLVKSPADCRPTESYIQWNQQGPQGDIGPSGERGPAGPRGQRGEPGPPGASGGTETEFVFDLEMPGQEFECDGGEESTGTQLVGVVGASFAVPSGAIFRGVRIDAIIASAPTLLDPGEGAAYTSVALRLRVDQEWDGHPIVSWDLMMNARVTDPPTEVFFPTGLGNPLFERARGETYVVELRLTCRRGGILPAGTSRSVSAASRVKGAVAWTVPNP